MVDLASGADVWSAVPQRGTSGGTALDGGSRWYSLAPDSVPTTPSKAPPSPRRGFGGALHIWNAIIGAAILLCGQSATADEALRLRMENFTVMPSTGPVVNVRVENRSDKELETTLQVLWPVGWKGAPESRKVTLQPSSTTITPFTIEKAIDVAANRYPVTIEARAGEHTVTRTQQIVCATAPYLKPTLDGQLDDWKDAAPITFPTAGKATTVMTCWNRRQFCLAVRADRMNSGAIQFALASAKFDKPGRFEFVVVVPKKDGPAKCFQLLKPGDDLAIAEKSRPLAGLECETLEAHVTRDGETMCIEVAAPVKSLTDLRPTPGRAFRFSALVHTQDGLRDLGSVMNLWNDQRSPHSWCRWEGAKFGPTPPFDSNVEFGFSSSIH